MLLLVISIFSMLSGSIGWDRRRFWTSLLVTFHEVKAERISVSIPKMQHKQRQQQQQHKSHIRSVNVSCQYEQHHEKDEAIVPMQPSNNVKTYL
mmetsp:Transcript_10836/g.31062  ORF Transcript_10836/g.31062 Transcript_10836/m.31062 type:complete len:94 (-) Transcript_10836:26-307(-)